MNTAQDSAAIALVTVVWMSLTIKDYVAAMMLRTAVMAKTREEGMKAHSATVWKTSFAVWGLAAGCTVAAITDASCPLWFYAVSASLAVLVTGLLSLVVAHAHKCSADIGDHPGAAALFGLLGALIHWMGAFLVRQIRNPSYFQDWGYVNDVIAVAAVVVSFVWGCLRIVQTLKS